MLGTLCAYVPVVVTAANAALRFFGYDIFAPVVDEFFAILCGPAAVKLHVTQPPKA